MMQAFFKNKIKISNKLTYHLKKLEKRTNKTQSQQKEGNNKDKEGNKYNRVLKNRKGILRSPCTATREATAEEAQWSSG